MNGNRYDTEHLRAACRALLAKAEMHRGLVAATRREAGLAIGHSRLANLAVQHAEQLVAAGVEGGALSLRRADALLAGYEALLWRGDDVHAARLWALRSRLIAAAGLSGGEQPPDQDSETEG